MLNSFIFCYRDAADEKQNVADVFMGYHPDTTAAIVLHVWDEKHGNVDDDVSIFVYT